jgi:hypothetical protein
MMQMGFVERFPPDLGCLENRQRFAFRTCENFQGPDSTDANSSTNIGKQRQYQGSETDTEETLISGSRHGLYWDLPLNHAPITQISPSFHQWVCWRDRTHRYLVSKHHSQKSSEVAAN